jgi:glyoxylase-like metal-dependent hydrolase (beta-lactamase superfamily II)
MRSLFCALPALVLVAVSSLDGTAQAPANIRLYVFDAGTLESDPARYQLKTDEVRATQLSVTAFLVVHPRGTLMWDTGAVPDDSWTPTGGAVSRRIILSDGRERPMTMRRPLAEQLSAAGYRPADITYLALSHAHWDHVANATSLPARRGSHARPNETPCFPPDRRTLHSRPPSPRCVPAARSSSDRETTTYSATGPSSCCRRRATRPVIRVFT